MQVWTLLFTKIFCKFCRFCRFFIILQGKIQLTESSPWMAFTEFSNTSLVLIKKIIWTYNLLCNSQCLTTQPPRPRKSLTEQGNPMPVLEKKTISVLISNVTSDCVKTIYQVWQINRNGWNRENSSVGSARPVRLAVFSVYEIFQAVHLTIFTERNVEMSLKPCSHVPTPN